MKVITAKASIFDREWVEFTLQIDETDFIYDVKWNAWGCHKLLRAAHQAAGIFKNKKFSDLQVLPGSEHHDLLMGEIVLKLKDSYKFPIDEAELCHCRKILALKVDEAVVLGAHTPEKVKAATSASSGCGTCRPEIQKLIDFRLRKEG